MGEVQLFVDFSRIAGIRGEFLRGLQETVGSRHKNQLPEGLPATQTNSQE